MLGADDEERRVVHRPPERAPLHRGGRGERRRELVGRTTAVVGDRERSVAREQRHGRGAGSEATLDVKRLPGARLLVLGEADAELAGVTERRSVERAGACPAGQREEQTQRPADRHVGARAGPECSHAAVDPERLAHGPVDDEDRARRLRGDADSVGVEAGLERGLGSRTDDGEGAGAAAQRGRRRRRGARASRRRAPAARGRARTTGRRRRASPRPVRASAGSPVARRSNPARSCPRARRDRPPRRTSSGRRSRACEPGHPRAPGCREGGRTRLRPNRRPCP